MTSSTRDAMVQAVHNLFIWMNKISESGAEMTLADIERLFTPNAPMILNNRVICRNRADHLQHGKDLQRKMRSWRFNLPFERTVVEGNTVVGYYTVDLVSRDGLKNRVHDICIFTVEDGKIASILENAVFEGQEVEVESFGKG